MKQTDKLVVNGRERTLDRGRGRMLLSVLREDLQLTGTKYGCGEGQCGACTVLIDGQATRSCVTSVDFALGKEVRTIEGLAENGQLHPVQRAFVEEAPMQCGHCTSGMILTAVDLLARKPGASSDDIVAGMNGNVCRCCAYPGYLSAVRRAATIMMEDRP